MGEASLDFFKHRLNIMWCIIQTHTYLYPVWYTFKEPFVVKGAKTAHIHFQWYELCIKILFYNIFGVKIYCSSDRLAGLPKTQKRTYGKYML